MAHYTPTMPPEPHSIDQESILCSILFPFHNLYLVKVLPQEKCNESLGNVLPETEQNKTWLEFTGDWAKGGIIIWLSSSMHFTPIIITGMTISVASSTCGKRMIYEGLGKQQGY